MKEQTEQTKMIKINPNISEFTVNVSGLNSPVKKKKEELSDCFLFFNSTICYSQETYLHKKRERWKG